MRVLSLAISLLALSHGANVAASRSSHLSTVNKAGGWGAVDASLEAGRFEPHHAHTWAPMAAAAPTVATKAGTTPTPTVQHFTYDPFDLEAGPSEWAKNFPTSQCAGNSQSPVQLPNYANAKADSLLKPLAPSYQMPASTVLSLRNTGHALQINMPTGLTLQGGALGANPYSVVQMHMHARSEHSVGGGHYPLEIHIVHMDPARDAATDPRALAVLGVMVAESLDNIANPALAPLVSLLPNFTTPLNNFNASAVLKQAFSLTNLLPANMDYYHYNGSLTTPPCSEQVVWHVLTTPIHASRAQILALTAPFGTVGNSRPTQPLNGRSVAVTSFYTPTPNPTMPTFIPTSSAFGADGALQGNPNAPIATGATTNKMNLPLIIGASAGGAVLLLLIVGVVIYRRRQTSSTVNVRHTNQNAGWAV